MVCFVVFLTLVGLAAMIKNNCRPPNVQCCYGCKDEEKQDINNDYGTYYSQDSRWQNTSIEVSLVYIWILDAFVCLNFKFRQETRTLSTTPTTTWRVHAQHCQGQQPSICDKLKRTGLIWSRVQWLIFTCNLKNTSVQTCSKDVYHLSLFAILLVMLISLTFVQKGGHDNDIGFKNCFTLESCNDPKLLYMGAVG